MGTTSVHMDPSMTPKEMFKHYNRVYLVDVKTQDNGWKYEMIDYSVSYGESWCIMKITRPDQSIIYDLSVHKTTFTGSKEYHNYYVKEISVSGGPYLYKCPKKFIDKIKQLDPEYFNTGYASTWLESWNEVRLTKLDRAKKIRALYKRYRINTPRPSIAI